jgi:hypothetical protein
MLWSMKSLLGSDMKYGPATSLNKQKPKDLSRYMGLKRDFDEDLSQPSVN